MLADGAIVAVTGATGFIGQHLVRKLRDDGFRVRALTRRAPSAQGDDGVTWVRGDLFALAALNELVAGADAVIHLAGAIKALGRDEFFRHNADGTRALAEVAASQATPPRFVLVSSLAAREPRLSPYAASKRAAEQVVAQFSGKMPVGIVRPPAVYGPGDRETLRIFAMAARGLVPVPAGQAARFSLIHGEDAAAAITAAMNQTTTSGAAISTWEPDDGRAGGYSWADVTAAAGAAVGSTPKTLPLPVPVLYAGGLIGSLIARLTQRPSTLTWGKVPEIAHPDWVATGGTIPGFTPRWTLEKGFENTVAWAISQGLLKSYS